MIAENLAIVREKINNAIKKRQGDNKNEDVILVAVTKNHDEREMREAIDNGIDIIGENRVQEAAKKYESLERNVSWHLIGHLQTNKVKQAVRMFELIHSVDSEHLLTAVNDAAAKIHKVQDILIQVNLAKEESKFGVFKEDLPFLIQKADMLGNVHLRGLMCIAPNFDDVNDARPLFREMNEIFSKLKMFPMMKSEMKYLSMGMTHDYEIAIEEGANIVRIGTAIFGPRDYGKE